MFGSAFSLFLLFSLGPQPIGCADTVRCSLPQLIFSGKALTVTAKLYLSHAQSVHYRLFLGRPL